MQEKSTTMRPLMKRWTCTIIAFLAVLLVGWYAGYDMLERGMDQAFFLFMAFVMATNVWICPIWPKEVRDE